MVATRRRHFWGLSKRFRIAAAATAAMLYFVIIAFFRGVLQLVRVLQEHILSLVVHHESLATFTPNLLQLSFAPLRLSPLAQFGLFEDRVFVLKCVASGK